MGSERNICANDTVSLKGPVDDGTKYLLIPGWSFGDPWVIFPCRREDRDGVLIFWKEYGYCRQA